MGNGAARAVKHTAPQISLVGDEEGIRPEYQYFMEIEGFASAICSNPTRATQMGLDNPSGRLAIIEVRMPNLDGASVFNQLRSILPQERHVESITLIDDTTPHIEQEIETNFSLIKPTNIQTIAFEISAALARDK